MKEPHTDRKFTNRAENPLLHDTWKLLSRYRDVTWSLELSVQQMTKSFEIEYGTSIDEFLDSVYLAGAELTGTNIEYQAKCIERSNKMLKLVDSSIDLLRNKHKNGETFYWVLYYTCLLYTSRALNDRQIIEGRLSFAPLDPSSSLPVAPGESLFPVLHPASFLVQQRPVFVDVIISRHNFPPALFGFANRLPAIVEQIRL